MACVTDPESLSPDERKILESIQTDFLPVEEISKKTGLPIFRVRSVLRKFDELEYLVELNGKYKAKSV